MQFALNKDRHWPLPDKCHATMVQLDQGTAKPDIEEYKTAHGKWFPKKTPLSESKLYDEWVSYCDYLDHFCGLCRLGEVVDVIKIAPNVVALSKNWSGSIEDHSDLELWLRSSKKNWYSIRTSLTCEIYSFGTIAGALPGSMEEYFGESRRDTRVSHLKGIYDVSLDRLGNPTSLKLALQKGVGGSMQATFRLGTV